MTGNKPTYDIISMQSRYNAARNAIWDSWIDVQRDDLAGKSGIGFEQSVLRLAKDIETMQKMPSDEMIAKCVKEIGEANPSLTFHGLSHQDIEQMQAWLKRSVIASPRDPAKDLGIIPSNPSKLNLDDSTKLCAYCGLIIGPIKYQSNGKLFCDQECATEYCSDPRCPDIRSLIAGYLTSMPNIKPPYIRELLASEHDIQISGQQLGGYIGQIKKAAKVPVMPQNAELSSEKGIAYHAAHKPKSRPTSKPEMIVWDLWKGMQALNHIAYMEEHKMTRSMLEGLPSRLPGIKPSCLVRLHSDGIISRKSKDNNDTTIWMAGTYLPMILEAWK